MFDKKKPINPRRFMLVLIFLLFGFSNSALATKYLPQADQSESIPTVQNQELSTPELIEQAFIQGEITAEQRLLYLAYAFGDYDKLPHQYRGQVPWRGTEVLLALQNESQRINTSSIRNKVEEVLSGICSTSTSSQPNTRNTTHFHIEYNTIGGGLSIDDYANSLERAWTKEIDQFGWAAPPVLSSNPPPGNRYHVRIDTIAPDLYGYVHNIGDHAGLVGDNPNTSWNDVDAQASCMVLNRDFSGFLGSSQQALDATTGHEFNHSIQHAYGALTGTNRPDPIFIEGGASWMEDEVHDSADDNYNYLWPQFDMCMGEYTASPYDYWITFRGLTERFGAGTAGGAEQVMQDFWESTSQSSNSNMLPAINAALASRGTTLAEAFHDYAIAVKFNKPCSGGYVYPYCFEEGANYVNAAGQTTVHDTISSVGGNYTGNLQDNYAINWISLPTRGIYSISLENTSANGKFRVSIVADTGSALHVTAFPAVVAGNNTVTLPEYEVPDKAKSVVAVITNEDQTADNPTSCTANPYKLSTAPPVAFVIDDTGSMGDEISDAKATVNQKVDEFVANGLFPNYHLLTYKDSVNYRDQTADPDTIKSRVSSLSASGGDDCPEEMLGALNRIAEEAPYSEAWLMTDAGFHGGAGDVAATVLKLIQANVKVHPIIYSWCFSRTNAEASNQYDASLERNVTVQGGVGPEAFVQIAKETGGHYFEIASSETQAATSILLNEMVTTSDLTTYEDEVNSTSSKTYDILVDSTTEEVNFLLNVFSGNVDLTVRDPAGEIVSTTDPNVTYTGISNAEYYQLTTPATGNWRAEISGNGTFGLSTSGNSSVSFAYLSDTSLAINQPVNLQASLFGTIKSSVFQFIRPDGTVVETVEMFDDGSHEDGFAGDGIYGGTYTPTTIGNAYFRVQGVLTDTTSFERVAPEIIRIQTLSVAGPAGQTVPPGTTVVYEFSVSNNGTVEDTFNLTISSSQGWADISGVPASVTIAAGGTAQVMVPIIVPGDAAPSTVDQTILVAISRLNSLANDAASVSTTVTEPAEATVALLSGWNLISAPLSPTPPGPTQALAGIAGSYDVVLSFENGASTYDPALPQHSTLTSMNGEHGYWVRMNNGASLTLRGQELAANTPVALEQGWNLVSYLAPASLPVEEALASIDGKYTTVLGYDQGATSFYNSIPPELNTLNTMEPGLGYWIKMTEPATLVYPESSTSNRSAQLVNRPQAPSGVTPTNEWVNVFSTNSTYNGQPLPAHTVITAIGEDGRKLGEMVVRESGSYGVLSVYRDDSYTDEVDGARRGEQISFLINGQPATITNGASPTWSSNGDLIEVDLAATGPTMNYMYLPLIIQ